MLINSISETLASYHRSLRALEKGIAGVYYLETKNNMSKEYDKLVGKINALRDMKIYYVKKLVEMDKHQREEQ